MRKAVIQIRMGLGIIATWNRGTCATIQNECVHRSADVSTLLNHMGDTGECPEWYNLSPKGCHKSVFEIMGLSLEKTVPYFGNHYVNLGYFLACKCCGTRLQCQPKATKCKTLGCLLRDHWEEGEEGMQGSKMDRGLGAEEEVSESWVCEVRAPYTLPCSLNIHPSHRGSHLHRCDVERIGCC